MTAAQAYYNKNKELVIAKNNLRYTIKRYLKHTTVFSSLMTKEEKEENLKQMVALWYKHELANLHTVGAIKNRTKQLQLEILDKYVDCTSAPVKENIDANEQKAEKQELEKEGLTLKEQNKRNYYLKNRDKCIAYSICYASEKKKLLKEARFKEDTEEFAIELKKRVQAKLEDYMNKEHRPYNAFTKKRKGVKPHRKTKTVNNVTATTAEVSGDTSITISGDVVITPEIQVRPTDEPIKLIAETKEPCEVVVMFKEPFFILWVISMIMSIGTLLAMFLYK
jgi:hypothetical protein